MNNSAIRERLKKMGHKVDDFHEFVMNTFGESVNKSLKDKYRYPRRVTIEMEIAENEFKKYINMSYHEFIKLHLRIRLEKIFFDNLDDRGIEYYSALLKELIHPWNIGQWNYTTSHRLCLTKLPDYLTLSRPYLNYLIINRLMNK